MYQKYGDGWTEREREKTMLIQHTTEEEIKDEGLCR